MMNILGSNKQLILSNNYKSNYKTREDLVLFLTKNLTQTKNLSQFKNLIPMKELSHFKNLT